MGKKVKIHYLYWKRPCYYCGEPVGNDVPYYDFCSPECKKKIRVEIAMKELLIGDPYLIRLRKL